MTNEKKLEAKENLLKSQNEKTLQLISEFKKRFKEFIDKEVVSVESKENTPRLIDWSWIDEIQQKTIVSLGSKGKLLSFLKNNFLFI